MQYLVETSWAIEYLSANADIVERLNRFLPDGVGINRIVLAELYVGVFKEPPTRKEQDLKRFIDELTIIPLNDGICRRYGEVQAQLLKNKDYNRTRNFDVLIAATALHHNLTLLTNDVHFLSIPGLRVISAYSA